MRKARAEDEAQLRFLKATTGHAPDVEPFGPVTAGYGLGRLEDYPASGLTTIVTFGAARQPFSIWRRLPLGNEAVLTVSGDTEPAEMLKAAVLEGHRRMLAKDGRRRVMEYNGVWAPGYPPHLFFTTAVSATPELLVKKKLGDQYVEFLSAVPIDDRELREYDRDVGRFIDTLAKGGLLPQYPRPAP